MRSGILISGSKHASISSAYFYACHLGSTRRDLWTASMSMHATFLLCWGLWWIASRSSINRVDVSDIHWVRGECVSGDGVG